MSVHNVIFFLKKNNHSFKKLYFSSINQYDQGIIDTLSLGEEVLKQLKVDHKFKSSLQNLTMQAVTRLIICHRHYTNLLRHNPASTCLLKVNNTNTRTKCEICSKLTIKTPELHHCSSVPCSSVSIVNFEQVNAGWEDITLVRYDYNEPCKGMYQFSCECDGLKTILKSLNVDSANGIFITLNKRKS